MVNSRSKGKRGELEVRDLVRKHGFQARRGQQFSGGGDSPDVVHDIPGVHIEVKLVETFNAYKALEQAERDSGNDEDVLPVVFHRRNRKKWIVVMDAEKFLQIMRYLGDDMLEPIDHPLKD